MLPELTEHEQVLVQARVLPAKCGSTLSDQSDRSDAGAGLCAFGGVSSAGSTCRYGRANSPGGSDTCCGSRTLAEALTRLSESNPGSVVHSLAMRDLLENESAPLIRAYTA
jgi:hypothetical protein